LVGPPQLKGGLFGRAGSAYHQIVAVKLLCLHTEGTRIKPSHSWCMFHPIVVLDARIRRRLTCARTLQDLATHYSVGLFWKTKPHSTLTTLVLHLIYRMAEGCLTGTLGRIGIHQEIGTSLLLQPWTHQLSRYLGFSDLMTMHRTELVSYQPVPDVSTTRPSVLPHWRDRYHHQAAAVVMLKPMAMPRVLAPPLSMPPWG
jgi:hypothetical protein